MRCVQLPLNKLKIAGEWECHLKTISYFKMPQYIGEIIGENQEGSCKIKIGSESHNYEIYKNNRLIDTIFRFEYTQHIDEPAYVTLFLYKKVNDIIEMRDGKPVEISTKFVVTRNNFITIQTLRDLVEE